MGLGEDDVVVNFAAEMNVDNYINGDQKKFIMSKVMGVQNIMEAINRNGNKCKLIQIFIDEVYG